MTIPFPELAETLKVKAAINADDTLAVRRLIWSDGNIDPAEAEAIFDLNNVCPSTSREWIDFFVEALSEYLVHEQTPQGYVDDSKANWLMQKIDNEGRVQSLAEIELLTKILEAADNTPDSLKTYALKQIETITLTGEGPTRTGSTISPGVVNAAEVQLLRRMLFAQASEGNATISTHEAEMLFRIKDATLGANNDPSWKTLFVQAVGNHMLMHPVFQAWTQDQAIVEQKKFEETKISWTPDAVVNSFENKDGHKSLFNLFFNKKDRHETLQNDFDDAIAVEAPETNIDDVWLNGEINADKQTDELEQALLDFLKQESAAR